MEFESSYQRAFVTGFCNPFSCTAARCRYQKHECSNHSHKLEPYIGEILHQFIKAVNNGQKPDFNSIKHNMSDDTGKIVYYEDQPDIEFWINSIKDEAMNQKLFEISRLATVTFKPHTLEYVLKGYCNEIMCVRTVGHCQYLTNVTCEPAVKEVEEYVRHTIHQ